MNATDRRLQGEQQITRAWAGYVESCLLHDTGRARLCMAHIDSLLERMPRQRTGE
jgi:hypothetical protein